MLGGGTPQPLPTVVLGTNAATPEPNSSIQPEAGDSLGQKWPRARGPTGLAQGGNLLLSTASGEQVKPERCCPVIWGRADGRRRGRRQSEPAYGADKRWPTSAKTPSRPAPWPQQALADASKALIDAQDARYQKNLARVSQAPSPGRQADLINRQRRLKDAQKITTSMPTARG